VTVMSLRGGRFTAGVRGFSGRPGREITSGSFDGCVYESGSVPFFVCVFDEVDCEALWEDNLGTPRLFIMDS